MENLQVTSLEKLKKVKQTEIINLGKFEDGTEFVAELKKPDLMQLAAERKIPNVLATEVVKLFNGKNKLAKKVVAEDDAEALAQLGELMNVLAEASLVNPTYKQLQEINIELTQEMKMSIMMFTQGGVETLKNFRKEQQRNENNQPGIEV
jgi:hypothetical protein